MKPAWKIREAQPSDSKGLQRCMQTAYKTYQKRMGGKRLPPMDVDYLSEIQNFPTWVIEFNGDIVGGLIMVFENSEASIANIGVDPKYQGKGIGGALMNFAQSMAKKNGYCELYLATHVLLEENISLYQYLGWKEIERDESRIRMKKDLIGVRRPDNG